LSKKEIVKLEKKISSEKFWQDQDNARVVSKQYENLKSEVEEWENIKQEANDLLELVKASKDDDALEQDINIQIDKLQSQFNQLNFAVLFSGKYDKGNAIISIHAGTGGVDAQDWTEILMRMYLRFCERHKFEAKVVDQTIGTEAGIKSATLEISGRYAYGWLKSEGGVHRLVRISPFDAQKMRHTSFALVEVAPETADVTIELKDDDLKIEVMRSSGHGGQSVNTTDSAVRIVHLPTKISVKCQNERSQLQNKKTALKILKSKLLIYYEAQENKKSRDIKGDYLQAQWGNQARSYVMQPYKQIKDHRTKYESQDIDRVLDGQFDDFVENYLRQEVGRDK